MAAHAAAVEQAAVVATEAGGQLEAQAGVMHDMVCVSSM